MRIVLMLAFALTLTACGSDSYHGLTESQAADVLRATNSRVSQAEVRTLDGAWQGQVFYDAEGDWPANQVLFMESENLRKVAAKIASSQGADRFEELLFFLRLPARSGGHETALKLRYTRNTLPAIAAAKTNWDFLNLASEVQVTSFGRPLVRAFCSDSNSVQYARIFCAGARGAVGWGETD